MVVFLVTLVVLLLFFAFIAIRVILLPNGEFHGTCGTNNPYLKREGGNCPVCGKEEGEECPNEILTEDLNGQQENG